MSDVLTALLDMLADRVAERLQTSAEKPQGKLLSIKDAASIMGVSEKSLRHQITCKSFPQRAIRRFGRRILIEREVFNQWLSAH